MIQLPRYFAEYRDRVDGDLRRLAAGQDPFSKER